MLISLEINDRLFNNIIQFCELNNVDINKYILTLIENGFNIDKYGDLNETLKETTVKVEEKIKDEIINNSPNIISKDTTIQIVDIENMTDIKSNNEGILIHKNNPEEVSKVLKVNKRSRKLNSK